MHLSFQQIEAIFSARYGVPPDRAIAFRGRLQNLQRHGLPDGANTGKGRKANYNWWQLAQLSIALDLIEIGLPPDTATKLIVNSSRTISMALTHLSLVLTSEYGIILSPRETLFVKVRNYFLSSFADDRLISISDMDFVVIDCANGLFSGDNIHDRLAMFIDFSNRFLHILGLIVANSDFTYDYVCRDFKDWVDVNGFNP
jgi:hypothetical protein